MYKTRFRSDGRNLPFSIQVPAASKAVWFVHW